MALRMSLLLVLLSLNARADCMDWRWSVFPPVDTAVPTNARFVVQAFGLAQPVVRTIAQRHPRLVTQDGEQFPLKVLEVNEGEFHVTQAVLQPKGALTVGTRYTLRFDQPDGPEAFELSRQQVPSWVVAPADFEAPQWITEPSAQPAKIVRYGCGPLIEARVAAAFTDASPVLFRVKVKRRDGTSREFLVERKEGDVAIGHGMCDGPFKLGQMEWTLELSAVDVAGNASPAPGPQLQFKGPEPLVAEKPDAG